MNYFLQTKAPYSFLSKVINSCETIDGFSSVNAAFDLSGHPLLVIVMLARPS